MMNIGKLKRTRKTIRFHIELHLFFASMVIQSEKAITSLRVASIIQDHRNVIAYPVSPLSLSKVLNKNDIFLIVFSLILDEL